VLSIIGLHTITVTGTGRAQLLGSNTPVGTR
jgi:hypothetical protein